MTVHATKGAKLFIGQTIDVENGDLTEASFSGATWTPIKEIEGLGSVGDTSQAVSFTSIEDSRDRVYKGTRSAGTMEVVMGMSANDPGQLALIEAEKSDDNFMFKIELSDGGFRYFGAMVMSQSEQYDQANTIMKLNASLAVNSNLVRA